MKKYRVKVETPGTLIFYKNKKIRSPFVMELDDSELELFKATMISAAVKSYEFEEIKQDDTVDEWELAIVKDEDVVIEYLNEEDEREPSTLLEKLLKDEKKNGE